MNPTALKLKLATKPGVLHFAAALFHSTPHLDRKRSHWNSRCSSNYYPKRKRKLQLKQSLLCNVSAYAEHMFQSCKSDFDNDEQSSWFRKHYGVEGSKKGRTKNQGPGFSGRTGFQFCDDDVDIESLFRAAFGGSKSQYWSFTADEIPQWRRGSSDFSNNHNRNTSRWKIRWEDEYASNSRHGTSWNNQFEDEYDSSAETDNANSTLSSDRVALGLSACGPLKLDEIKSAYRQCALKWHPDRHQGSSKQASAEENFKKCSAAYESLCSKMATA
ncbi:unnamed protein product [Rhodiola kirilowii]